MSFPGSGDGLILTPGPAGMSDTVPLATSIDTSRVSFPGSGDGRRFASVCSAVMQYATRRRPSAVHLGLPQKLPCSVIRFRPEPSGRITYTSAICKCSHRPCANGIVLPRVDENAIHLLSGDHVGRKSPAAAAAPAATPVVSAFACRVFRSMVHRRAVPPFRELTKTSDA